MINYRLGPDRRLTLGIPAWAVIGLAALSAPRVVLHDLDIVPERTALAAALAIVPPLIWIAAVLRARVPTPLYTLLAIGAVYGLILAVVHNLLWHQVFDAGAPTIGSDLATSMSPRVEELVVRAAMSASSLLTGVAIGLISGVIATGLRRVLERHRGSARQ